MRKLQMRKSGLKNLSVGMKTSLESLTRGEIVAEDRIKELEDDLRTPLFCRKWKLPSK